MATKKDGTERKPRTKKELPVEESKIETPETETPIEQPEIKKEDVGIHLGEVKSFPVAESILEVKTEEQEPIFNAHNIQNREVELESELSMEDKIASFLDGKGAGEIKMNDLLKSLFPVPKFNEPSIWQRQESSKQIKVLLEDMQSKGLLTIVNDTHRRLGTAYYPDHTTGKTHYYDLNNVIITAKK